MMIARKAVLGGVGKHGAQDPEQGFLGQKVVADMVDGHETILGNNP